MKNAALLGAVLAGGESRRFGSAKALAPFRGRPMIIRALEVVSGVAEESVVVTSVEPVARSLAHQIPGVRIIPDRVAGAGPLAGLHAALHHAAERSLDGVVLLACDMPLASSRLLARVVGEGQRSGRPAAVPVGASGRAEPLCAWYSLACLPVVERRLSEDDRSMAGLLAEVDPWRVALDPASGPESAPGASLRSANTPEELQRLEALAQDGAPVPPAVLVVGFKDSGKTTVAVKLVAELRSRGLRVGALKHGHGFRLDTPGTDSWRLANEGGANPVLLAGPEGFALMGGWKPEEEPGLGDLLSRHFHGSDGVVVEGYKEEPLPRVEVHRVGSGDTLLSVEISDEGSPFLALVVDDSEGLDTPVPVPILTRDDPDLAAELANLVEARVLRPRTGVAPKP